MNDLGKKGRARKAQRRKQKKEMKNMSNYKTTTKTIWKPSKNNCHTGQKVIFTTTSGIDVYGGGRSREGGWWKTPVTVDLAMGPDETMRPYDKSALSGGTIVPDGWSCDDYTGRIDPPKHMIHIDFPDFGVPQVDKLFWYALCDDIVEHGIKSISTQCQGGHGRTGVQLCILYYLLNDDDTKSSIADAGQLIDLIRDLHCHHAVETDGQQRYIANVLDIDVGESKIEKSSYGGWGGYSWPTGGDKGKANPKAATTTTTTTSSYDHNEKYNMKSKSDQYMHFCECCGETDYDILDDVCRTCGWTQPDPNNAPSLCYTCGEEKPLYNFLKAGDETCITCIALEKKIKHRECEVQCVQCGKMKYTDMVAEMTEKGFVCLACEVKQ